MTVSDAAAKKFAKETGVKQGTSKRGRIRTWLGEAKPDKKADKKADKPSD